MNTLQKHCVDYLVKYIHFSTLRARTHGRKNGVVEMANREILERVRSALNTVLISFQNYGALCAEDTVTK